ncbi:MAG: phosphotransferase [Rhodospirillales bacterium]|nr:phosphotransferase [Rhodospirillales bacterium]
MRRSVRLFLEDRSVIVTKRRAPARARLEAEVLQALSDQGAPVPGLLGFDGVWLIQEDLGSSRLSQALAAMHEAEAEGLLENAIAGLAAAQQAGRERGLDRQVVAIGKNADWIATLATIHRRIGEQLQLSAPALPTDRLVAQLRPQRPAFIKWDARPANAAIRADGAVAWFDWEHCGCRHPLDDVVWLLCDEYTPDLPKVEERLIGRILPWFLNGSAQDVAYDYLMTFGALHGAMRLSLILTEKADGPWWDPARCLDLDSVGVTSEMALRLCRRSARWAARGSLTPELGNWFEEVAERLAA